MSFHKVPYRDDGYAVYAALGSIDAYLLRAQRNMRQAQRELEWLQALRDHRAGQSEDEWFAEVRARDAAEKARRALIFGAPSS